MPLPPIPRHGIITSALGTSRHAPSSHDPDITDCCGQVLGDLVEALTGAIFLDTGQDLDATWQVRPFQTSKEVP